MASHIPRGHNAVSPYLITTGAGGIIELLKAAFGAEDLGRHLRPDGTIMHAEVRIGDSVIMLSDGNAEFPPAPAMVHVYVPDVDAAYRRALQAGATSVLEPSDQFYGDRSAGIRDAAGNQWWIATHKEDLSPEEIARRAEAAMKQR